MTANHHQIFPRAAPLPTSSHTSIEVVNNGPYTRTLNRKQLQRHYKLRDEVYPLKLVRELDRIVGELPSISKKKYVFEVVHVNNSTDNGPTVENVSIYSTVQAANDRALDFWDQQYGTGMFTNAPPAFGHIGESWKRPYRPSRQMKMNSRSAGGIPTNGSYWAINNNCLSLSHKVGKGEKRVHVVILNVKDQGIHDQEGGM
ncbi:hypothetical protein F4824DRAFT_458268 [Ustulina deusta]|nr:hypothetical protein F4824DRAFT_458268 [Ustulina deusta]